MTKGLLNSWLFKIMSFSNNDIYLILINY